MLRDNIKIFSQSIAGEYFHIVSVLQSIIRKYHLIALIFALLMILHSGCPLVQYHLTVQYDYIVLVPRSYLLLEVTGSDLVNSQTRTYVLTLISYDFNTFLNPSSST